MILVATLATPKSMQPYRTTDITMASVISSKCKPTVSTLSLLKFLPQQPTYKSHGANGTEFTLVRAIQVMQLRRG